ARLDIHFYAKAIFVAEFFEREILAREFEFVGKGDEIRAIFFECVAKHVAEAFDSLLGGGGVEFDESGKRVERVEEEMGIQPRAKRIEASGVRKSFGLLREQFFFVKATADLHGVGDAGDEPVNPDTGEELKSDLRRVEKPLNEKAAIADGLNNTNDG